MAEPEVRHIYVALLGAGADTWRRVEAVYEGEDAYRILSVNEGTGEQLEYNSGESVRCRGITLPSGERVLVATERLDPNRRGPTSDRTR